MLVKEKIGDRRRANYETLPSGEGLELLVLDLPKVCRHCGEPVVYDAKGGSFGWGGYVHVDSSIDHSKEATTSPVIECVYCGAQGEDTVHYRQHAWHDAVECDRCGGENGHAIGD